MTGASRGIGRGIAVGLGEAGATVVVAARSIQAGAAGGSSTAGLVEAAGGTALALPCDVTDAPDVIRLFERVERELGRVDLLVNCAASTVPMGILFGDAPFWELEPSRWDEQLGVTVRGAFLCAQRTAAIMVRQGAGLIVNISSAGAKSKFAILPYGVAKAAMDRMTADMALELKDHGVAVVSLWPPPTSTEEMIRGADETDDPSTWSEPVFTGRVVAALAASGIPMERTGQAMRVRELARDLAVEDVPYRPS